MATIQFFFKKHLPDAPIPVRLRTRSAALDLMAYVLTESGRKNQAILPPHTTRPFRTGLGVLIPLTDPAWYAQIVSHPILAARSISVADSPQIIDPDNTEEIVILLHNGGNETQYIKHGDHIAQLVLAPAPRFDVRWLEPKS